MRRWKSTADWLARLAHDHRVAVLFKLAARGEAPARELAGELDLDLDTLGYHIRDMKSLGVLAVRQRGRTQYYRLAVPEGATELVLEHEGVRVAFRLK